jgi:hypothetical protein
VYGQIITSLFVFQLFMIGILGVKKSYTSFVVLPLLFISVIFTRVCAGVFERPFSAMSLRGAVDLDNHERVRNSGPFSTLHCRFVALEGVAAGLDTISSRGLV